MNGKVFKKLYTYQESALVQKNLPAIAPRLHSRLRTASLEK
jgi:hypothetical protein